MSFFLWRAIWFRHERDITDNTQENRFQSGRGRILANDAEIDPAIGELLDDFIGAQIRRREWCVRNPCEKIALESDMPAKPKGAVEVLTVAQGKAIMRQIELHEPLYVGWACIQYFFGVRDAEAERFRGEWIQRKTRRILLPGWHLDGTATSAVTKTRFRVRPPGASAKSKRPPAEFESLVYSGKPKAAL